jgi:hypothetical protein
MPGETSFSIDGRRARDLEPRLPQYEDVVTIDYFYQQMHQDKFVTVFFIERVTNLSWCICW